MHNDRIVIIGAGPCGLGAAWRLTELGYDRFEVIEQHAYPGGLSASFCDSAGFTWDIGGHVLFSHYPYVDELLTSVLSGLMTKHQREAWCYLRGRFVPYPFQYNFRHLEPADVASCLSGLAALPECGQGNPKHFHDWILDTFGEAIAELFMLPHNSKVWAHPLDQMSYSWISERVPRVDAQRAADNVRLQRDDVSWGPNAAFLFPAQGGIGAIWKSLADRIAGTKITFGKAVVAIDATGMSLTLADGRTLPYDILISTMPLDLLVQQAGLAARYDTSDLQRTSTHVVGIGMRGLVPAHLVSKSWIYYPEDEVPFYRVTVFSNYSSAHVPADGRPYWSLLAEVSESRYRPVDVSTIVEQVIAGSQSVGLISDRNAIVATWHHVEPYGYPVPTLDRDTGLSVLSELEARHIYSRGRFGAWAYEVGNMDHALMQGVELIDRLLLDHPETTLRHRDDSSS